MLEEPLHKAGKSQDTLAHHSNGSASNKIMSIEEADPTELPSPLAYARYPQVSGFGLYKTTEPHEVSFHEGNSELRVFPDHLMKQLRQHCAEHKTKKLNWGVTRARTGKDLFGESGRSVHWEVRETEEELLAARYHYGNERITIVKEQNGTAINGGSAVLITPAGSGTKYEKIERNGVTYRVYKYHVWKPLKDVRNSDIRQAEILKFTCPAEQTSEVLPSSETSRSRQRPIPDWKDLQGVSLQAKAPRKPLLADIDMPQTFERLEGHDVVEFRAFPPSLEVQIRTFITTHEGYPSCARAFHNSRGVFKDKGRECGFYLAATADGGPAEEQLKAAMFKGKGRQQYITLWDGGSGRLQNGEVVLLGLNCGGSTTYRRSDGVECSRTYYHAWSPALRCPQDGECDPEIMKLSVKAKQPQRPNQQVGTNRRISELSIEESDKESHRVSENSTGDTTAADRSGQTKRRRTDSDEDEGSKESNFREPYSRKRSMSERTRESPVQQLPFQNRHQHRGRISTDDFPQPQPTPDTSNISFNPGFAQSMSSTTSFSHSNNSASISVRHEFHFMRGAGTQVLRRKPISICRKVHHLFQQAKAAGIIETDRSALLLCRETHEPVQIIGADQDELDIFMRTLEGDAAGLEQIMVLPDLENIF